MSSRSDRDWLLDIQEAAERIATYTASMDCATFLADEKTQDAVVRNLEIVGEATKQLSDAIRSQYDDLPWREMAGARDRLIHGYFGVNLDVIWGIIVVDLPYLLARVTEILDDLQ